MFYLFDGELFLDLSRNYYLFIFLYYTILILFNLERNKIAFAEILCLKDLKLCRDKECNDRYIRQQKLSFKLKGRNNPYFITRTHCQYFLIDPFPPILLFNRANSVDETIRHVYSFTLDPYKHGASCLQRKWRRTCGSTCSSSYAIIVE